MIRRKEKSKLNLDFLKNHKKIMFSLVAVITFLSFFLAINYGRYVKDIIEVYYLRTQNFYFNSNKLTIHGKEYEIYPWSAVDPYSIDIQMTSFLNSLKGTSSDVLYEVTCEADERVDCIIDNINNTDRVISVDTKTDNFSVKIQKKNTLELKDGDRIPVTITAKSKKPYVETLSATFIFVIGDYGINNNIENVPGNIYFDSVITNTLADEKAIVTLKIRDITKASFDMSSSVFNIVEAKDIKKDGDYINEITFEVEPKSSMMVRFYKKSNFNNNNLDDVLLYSVKKVKVVE